jgi:phosphoesterase RecJ-like protein
METLGAKTAMVAVDPVPDVYAFLPRAGMVLRAEDPAARAHLSSADLLVYLDCATAERAGIPGSLGRQDAVTLNIDHHASNTRYADLNWVLPAASSTGEMVAEVFLRLRLPFGDARDPLYAAIVADTGSFAYESTAASTHRLAATLLDQGLSPDELHERLYSARPMAAALLLARALATLTTAHDGQVAYMVLVPADYAAAGASPAHADGIVNYAREIAGVKVGLLFSSHDGREIKVGLRSRPGVDANAIAARFGGGGHARAAGCRLATDLAAALAAVLGATGEALERLQG